MNEELANAHDSDHTSPSTLHGFSVQSYGNPISRTFRRALRRMAERGFDDPACVVVKTQGGKRSGITHAGGRYMHAESACRTEVLGEMRAQGMEPPPFPFVVAPGENMLYHEWGHHVDYAWSGTNKAIRFSFRWFSHFYQLSTAQFDLGWARQALLKDHHQSITLELLTVDAAVSWWQLASELFANLFEDWMRGEKRVNWDRCEPATLNMTRRHGPGELAIELLPGVSVRDVRAGTYDLLEDGIRAAIDLPPVRPDLFGDITDAVVDRLREAMAMMES